MQFNYSNLYIQNCRNNVGIPCRVSFLCSVTTRILLPTKVFFVMGQIIRLFYISLLLLILIAFPADALQVPHTVCFFDFNYTHGSTLDSNLNTVFNSLVQHTSQTGFNTCVDGQIYGLLQCSRDTTAEQCRNCSHRAVTTIRHKCGNTGGGLILLDDCFLRYEKYDFFGQMSTGGWYNYNHSNMSTPDVFNAAVESLLTNLSGEAASGSKLYASGTSTDSLSRRIYGVVQCTRDISSIQCKTCLLSAINFILSRIPGSAGATVLSKSCNAHYEMYPFFNSILPPSPSTAKGPAIAPTKRHTQSPAVTPGAYPPGKQMNGSNRKS